MGQAEFGPLRLEKIQSVLLYFTKKVETRVWLQYGNGASNVSLNADKNVIIVTSTLPSMLCFLHELPFSRIVL